MWNKQEDLHVLLGCSTVALFYFLNYIIYCGLRHACHDYCGSQRTTLMSVSFQLKSGDKWGQGQRKLYLSSYLRTKPDSLGRDQRMTYILDKLSG